MKSMSFLRFSCSALLLTGLFAPLPMASVAIAEEPILIAEQNQSRLRIAVLDFDYASTGGQNWVWYGGIAPSQGVSDLLTNQLADSNVYTLIERSQIATVLAEQNLGASGRIDANTAAQVGQILGADAVVIGSITRFNLEENETGGSILGIGGGRRRHQAEVQLTARFVNTTTGEIIATAQGEGTARQDSGAVSIGGISVGSSTNNPDELLSEAAEEAVGQLTTEFTESDFKERAVNQISGQLSSQVAGQGSSQAANQPTEQTQSQPSEQAAGQPTAQPNTNIAATLPSESAAALVADVADQQVIINQGSANGFEVGMTVSIERVTREVKDPATGEVLRRITSPVGQIELTEVDERSAVGRVVSGSDFRVGDQAVVAQQ